MRAVNILELQLLGSSHNDQLIRLYGDRMVIFTMSRDGDADIYRDIWKTFASSGFIVVQQTWIKNKLRFTLLEMSSLSKLRKIKDAFIIGWKNKRIGFI